MLPFTRVYYYETRDNQNIRKHMKNLLYGWYNIDERDEPMKILQTLEYGRKHTLESDKQSYEYLFTLLHDYELENKIRDVYNLPHRFDQKDLDINLFEHPDINSTDKYSFDEFTSYYMVNKPLQKDYKEIMIKMRKVVGFYYS